MGQKRNAYRLLEGKPEGKRPLGRPRLRLVDNIKMDLLEIGWGGVDWIGLPQDRNKWGALAGCLEKSCTMVFQMFLYGECYENVCT
jgi:hypothetical protein